MTKAKPTEMKTNKLELKHLAPYLPYGLRGNYSELHNVEVYQLTMRPKIITESFYIKYKWLKKDDQCYYSEGLVSDGEFKPYLRPLSDLTKEIMHNGEKFVPIIELHKIATKHQRGKQKSVNEVIYNKNHLVAQLIFKNIYFHTGQNLGRIIFEIDTDPICFSIIHEHGEEEDYMFAENQLQLFQKMFEWHFNVFNLDKELWIDVNKLPENPYK